MPDRFFSDVDILLFPSSKEGLGFSVLEAKAAGCVVIASSVGGLVEIVKDGYDGFLLSEFSAFNLVKVFRKLMEDGVFREIVNNARESMKNFSIESMASRTRKVYEKALKVEGVIKSKGE